MEHNDVRQFGIHYYLDYPIEEQSYGQQSSRTDFERLCQICTSLCLSYVTLIKPDKHTYYNRL